MPSRTFRSRLALVAALLAFALTGAANAADAPARGKSIVVFAAASLTDVLGEIDKAYTAKTGVEVKASFAASSALARQIENGAKAEVFFSADEEWMDYLAQRKLLKDKTRADVVGNRLVLIAPRDSRLTAIEIKPGLRLDAALGEVGHIATGDPDSVPVGKYARAALTKFGTWESVERRRVRAENVRAALAYVARGEANLGIVYATDAQAEKKVKIVGTFPRDSHAPIRYPIAVTTAGSAEGAKYAEFVRSGESAEIFARYGFEVLK